ncbi:P2X purinoceptor 7-like [Ornithodoros turicata]|uniref:P2X purinoceptor 7-like n=1 Tax=Ornithodoros turicata TaxID=34597 RepID=UPI00313978A8
MMSGLPNLTPLERRILEVSKQLNFCSYDSTPGRLDTSESECDDLDSDDSPPQSPDRPNGFRNWCSCNNCRAMPTHIECLCCRDVPEATIKQPHDCITHHEDFEILCLNPAVLGVAAVYIREQMHEEMDADRGIHERYRHIAYRQFTHWVWGPLGKENRKVLPSCVVTRIRDEFPSETYTGFRYPPL